jgi:FMN phosphatase YigB (HAD superfamily)
MSAWGNLQPRVGATEVLSKLSKKYQLGLLSNADKTTLQAALRVFPSSVNVSLILSSDYPANCFKPCSAMYAQALDAVHNDKSQVLHIAGSAFDTHGARTFGIYSGVMDSSALHTSPQPCFAFDDLEQLLSFFDV